MASAPQLVDVKTLLAGIPLFLGVSADGLSRLTAATCQRTLVRGDILFRKNDNCDGLHIVVYGCVKLFFLSQQGGEKILDILASGSPFCEATMFAGGAYRFNAESLTDCLLLHVSKTAILDELDNNPNMARSVIDILARKFLERNADIEAYSLHSGRQRVIQHLLGEVDELEGRRHGHVEQRAGVARRHTGERAGQRMIVNLLPSKGDIASRLNLTHEHFSRLLHELSSCGMIGIDKRAVHIRDVERLRIAFETNSTASPA